MTPWLILGTAAALACWAGLLWKRRLKARRLAFLRQWHAPAELLNALQTQHPTLTMTQCQQVGEGLRQFFIACLLADERFVAMPSRVVDDLWHLFILRTRAYDAFCRQAFGSLLHHSPATTPGAREWMNVGLRRAWRLSCAEEDLDARQPSRVPLLFALDGSLGVANGYQYVLGGVATGALMQAAMAAQGGELIGSVELHLDAGEGCGGHGGADSGDGGDGSCGGGCGGGGD